MIVEAGWDLMVQWKKGAHCEGPKRKDDFEQKQIALGDDVADMLAKRGAEGDGASVDQCTGHT